MMTTFHASNWHPLTWLSHASDYALWGLNPAGHHLTSIILHGLNTFLVVILTMSLIRYGKAGSLPDQGTQVKNHNRTYRGENSNYHYSVSLCTGAVTGLLFGLHPLHVESVAWISERKDVLCAFFYLLCILSYLKYVNSSLKREKTLHYTVSLLFLLLSLMSKPMAITLPAALIILDIYPLRRLTIGAALSSIPIPFVRKGERNGIIVITEKLPFFALSLFLLIVTIMAQKAGEALVLLEQQLAGDRILTVLRSIGFYLYRTFWPADLVPFYPYPSEISLLNYQYAGALIFVLSIFVFCIWSRKKYPVFTAAFAYYVITLFPFS
jgi:hypothetical protein